MGYALARAGMRSVPRLPPPPTPLTPSVPSRSRTTPRSAQPQPEVRWRGYRLPAWIARLLLPDSVRGHANTSAGSGPGGSPVTERAKLPVQGLQVLVLVSMPSPERAWARRARVKAVEAGDEQDTGKQRAAVSYVGNGQVGLGEYALGVARMPWSDCRR